MTTPGFTPPDPGRTPDEVDLSKRVRPTPGPGAEGSAPASEPAGASEPPFDPYRFGKPEQPVPPEFAPPGYVPDTPSPSPAGSPPYPYPQAPYGQQNPYPQNPYPQSPYPPYGNGSHGNTPYGPRPGYPPGPPGSYGPPQTGTGKAVTALVSGIASILLCWLTFLDIVPVVLAVVFGILALNQARKGNGAGRGMAIGGLVCGAIGAVLAIVLTVVVVHLANTCGRDYQSGTPEYNQCIKNQF